MNNYTRKRKNNKTLKNNFLENKKHKQFLNDETYDRFELVTIFKKVNKRLVELKKKLKSRMNNKSLTMNDYYFLHNVRDLLLKNKINNNRLNYNESKKLGKEIKELLLYLNRTDKYKHLKTGKILNKIKQKSTKKKLGSRLRLKKYENKNFAEYFSSNNITNKLNKKVSKNNSNDVNNIVKEIEKTYFSIVNNNNNSNNNKNNNNNKDPKSVLNLNKM